MICLAVRLLLRLVARVTRFRQHLKEKGGGGAVNDVNILPYQFEPYLPEPEATSSDDNDASGERIDRRYDNSW